MEQDLKNDSNHKSKLVREYYIPLASVVIAGLAIISNIAITYINSNSQIEVKQFEITYLEKRKSYSDVLTSINKIKSYMSDLSYNSNVGYYEKYFDLVNELERDVDSLYKFHKFEDETPIDDVQLNSRKCIDSINVELDNLVFYTNYIQPFLGDNIQSRNNLLNKTTEFKINVKMFINKFVEKENVRKLNKIYKTIDSMGISDKYDDKQLQDTINIETTGQIVTNYIAPFQEYILNELYNALFINL